MHAITVVNQSPGTAFEHSAPQNRQTVPFAGNTTLIQPQLKTRGTGYDGKTKTGGASLPDRPDRRAMRMHRAAGEMKVSQLRRLHEPAASRNIPTTHELVMDAYGYQAAADTAIALLRTAADFLGRAVQSLPNFHFPLPGAEAASTDRAARNHKPITSVANFKLKFRKDFDIRVSPSLQGNDNLEGVTVVIGEHHYRKEVRSQINQVLRSMDESRGDLLIREGSKALCLDAAAELKINNKNCIPIEEDIVFAAELIRLEEERQDATLEFLKMLKKYLPDLSWKNLQPTDEAIAAFIIANDPKLPKEAGQEREYLLNRVDKSKKAIGKMLDEKEDSRGKNMMAFIRKYSRPDTANFVVLGQAHVYNLARELFKEKVILMTPHLVNTLFPKYLLPALEHEEL